MTDCSILELGRQLREGCITAVSLAEIAINAARVDRTLNAYVSIFEDRAFAEAAQADIDFENGVDRGPMQGIPYAVKELFDVAGMATTGQSRLVLDPAKDDADAIAMMTNAGAVLVGKTTTYELAIEPRPSLYGLNPPARNPHDLSRTTGGSSSGSAAAVAGGLIRLALGTDTGGSIRAPASYCGIVGLKPTYDRVSRRGALPLSFSLDHVGPMAATVADAAVGFDALIGDACCQAAIDQDPNRMKLGYARSFHASSGPSDILDALDRSAENFAKMGISIEEVQLPEPRLFDAAATVIIQAEAFALHRDLLEHQPNAYGRQAFQHLAAGAVLLAADLVQAQRVRASLMQAVQKAIFPQFDAVLTANVLGTAPRLDGSSPANQMRVFPFNLTGHPALALPIGVASDGMPIGLQLVGRPFDEAGLFRLGAAYERHVYRHPILLN